ncbi:ArsR family transcriptional regulator [Litorimonas taeanensis]|uniref:ArsR family transcriptional regulator n=1 Tax=Litorimonas taeanensis TaxID=568099 RepID=A0A420WL06_9PROT|nr:metalloregulator ArsR/SmtB family transcription factor [Litorimonas taeanensis]RKQ71596.1 ArsR family transcriptional regulator [Litorimonas taeanensis]
MESKLAVQRLSALAQTGRLSVFRLLVKAGKEGLSAGEIAKALNVPANTLSAQLNILSSARLVTSIREGRSIIYTAQFDHMAELVVYLVEDCCQGHADVCEPLEHATKRINCC